MANELSNGFDESSLPAEVRGKLTNIEYRIKRRLESTAKQILEYGEDLHAGQELLADYRKGIFVDWVESRFPFSKSTAYNYIQAWQTFGSFPTVGNLDVTAMYRLANPETPKLAVNAAKKMAEKGQVVTAKVAEQLIQKYTHEAPKEERTKEAPRPAADTENRTDSGSGNSTERDLENCDHEWVSDGNGERYCTHCKMDHPEDVKRPRKAAEPVAKTHLMGIAKTIEHLRVKIDEIVSEHGRHASTEQIMADLDKALISLKKWAGSVK